MKKHLLLLFLSIYSLALFSQGTPVGWATVGIGTTGGIDGETVTVRTRDALVTFAALEEPMVIRVSDTIDLNLYERVKVKSNKTIIGITTDAMLRFGGLEIVGNNVIIRNLIIGDSYDGDWEGKTNSTDAITVVGQNVWVDHCWLKTSADGLFDVRSNNDSEIGDFVTISYTRFSDHNKVSLIGSSDETIRDRDRLQTSFHHCWFDGTIDKGLHQRLPRIRYGNIHLFNNYFENIADYCILARLESDVVVENNYFRNSLNPHGIEDVGLGIKDPELVANGNIYELSSGDKKTAGTAFNPSDFYEYGLDETSVIPAKVMNEAGPFNPPSNKTPIAITDTVFLANGERTFELNPTLNDLDPDGDELRLGNFINEFDGQALIRNNSFRYLGPIPPERPDTLQYELVDTKGGYAIGQVIIQFEGLSTSLFESLPIQDLSIAPNPAKDWIEVNFTSDSKQEITLKVWEVDGRPFEGKIEASNMEVVQRFRIYPTNLQPRLLLISLIAQNSVLTRKVQLN